MTENIPVACTLTAAGLATQRRRWEQLMARALTGRAETADGLRLSFRPEAEDELRALVAVETGQRAGLTLDEIRALLSATADDQAAIERLREVAVRKLPQVRELIERTELVRDWLEAAVRCECPSLDECPLFDDPARLPQKVPGF